MQVIALMAGCQTVGGNSHGVGLAKGHKQAGDLGEHAVVTSLRGCCVKLVHYFTCLGYLKLQMTETAS